MIRVIWLLILVILIPMPSLAQSAKHSYAGHEQREIKALSADEVQAYLSGHGMGLAKTAELNHYPGPRHVLDLSVQLRLSQQQITETQTIYDKMHAEAVRVGKQIVEQEKKLDSLFATGEIDQKQLIAIVNDIARLQGELRMIHLQAHLDMKHLLSATQIARYDEVRGNGQSGGTGIHQQHQYRQH